MLRRDTDCDGRMHRQGGETVQAPEEYSQANMVEVVVADKQIVDTTAAVKNFEEARGEAMRKLEVPEGFLAKWATSRNPVKRDRTNWFQCASLPLSQ